MSHWYMVDKDGMATLCEDRADAEHEAREADMTWPRLGPHRAVQLVDAAHVQQLRDAAQAVIDRWDTPLWKDVPATAEYIGRLRKAMAL